MVATPLPMKLVSGAALAHEPVDAEDRAPCPAPAPDSTTASVAARVMKPAPVTPARALRGQHGDAEDDQLVGSVSSTPSAWAMNSAASVM